jgi:hypothetical protein
MVSRVLSKIYADILSERAQRRETAKKNGWDKDGSIYHAFVMLGAEPLEIEPNLRGTGNPVKAGSLCQANSRRALATP